MIEKGGVLLKKSISIFLYIVISLIAGILLTIGIFILIAAIQRMLFVPNDYIMWTFNYPYSRFVLIYELYILVCFFSILRKFRNKGSSSQNGFIKRNRKYLFPLFVAGNIVLFYTIVTSVTVITGDKITDYSFLHPQGREYNYKDAAKIEAGVYGKTSYVPFTHSKGDFFYIIELDNGRKIDLTEVGGVKNDEHEFFMIEELDRKFVKLGIPKVSSMENIEYTTEYLDKMYTDKIRNILKNTN